MESQEFGVSLLSAQRLFFGTDEMGFGTNMRFGKLRLSLFEPQLRSLIVSPGN